jgi:hypothetical protein
VARTGGTFIVKAVANKEVVARLEREEKARGEEEANVVVTATRWYNLMVVETEDIRMDFSRMVPTKTRKRRRRRRREDDESQPPQDERRHHPTPTGTSNKISSFLGRRRR